MITVDKAWKKNSWKTNQTEFFRSTSLQILANKSGCVQTNLLLFFIDHIWGERKLWGAVFVIQTSYKMQYFTVFQDKLHSFNFQDHRSTRELLISETVQKISKITPIRPSGSNFWQAPNLRRNFKRVTLQRDKEFIESIFY